jgi:pSer/pThr/pTyr-binding forkhead associated (FHA) protein
MLYYTLNRDILKEKYYKLCGNEVIHCIFSCVGLRLSVRIIPHGFFTKIMAGLECHMAKFSVSYNGKIIKTYELEDAIITIGRLPENKICISNMGISRRHAKLEKDGNNNFTLTDFSSLNGTFVNNKKVSKALISRGDTITIGKYTIVFEPDEKNASAEAVIKEQPSKRESFLPETALKEVPAKEQTSISSEQPKEAVSSVLIETNKHVVYKLDKQFITLGASENDDIFVSGFLVGEGHVEIERKENELWIRSQKFMGKFRVNGRKEKNHLLQHKDRIEIGSSLFRYMENG